ncbi:MAG: YaiI/YqxD family protein [Proteobacteria bacterium]|nr:YaiI/YqxD family protein [Pseudomonadota bacterium]
MINIYVDADASPVKNEVLRVAKRYGLKVYLVSNSAMRIPQDKLVEMIVVGGHLDAADDWIVDHIADNDIAVSADIPLASRCLKKGARVLDPKGRIFTEESIGSALANRDLMTYLRDMGNMTGGAAPYDKQDRSRFLQRLDDLIQAVLRGKR